MNMENHKIDSRKLILERKDSLLLIPLFSLKVKNSKTFIWNVH